MNIIKRIQVLLVFNLAVFSLLHAQALRSPWEYFDYAMGSKFTRHDKVEEYIKYVAGSQTNTKLTKYGMTYEGRPLYVLAISSLPNIQNLEKHRKNNLQITREGKNQDENAPVIVWLSYNVHGNEAVSTEAALETIYQLCTSSDPKIARWLENTIVMIDPCLNPDGRERYVQFYTQTVGNTPNIESFTREHDEGWPSGRTNHYHFDLNRDWAWQTQIESKARISEYKKWMPHVHVDFHEMGINSPYYFAPAAEPMHEQITKFQRELQTEIGRNNADHFDKNGWLYFTKQIFDLFYPSYGDTYPTFNGSVGMTYEQGGSGRAGLSVLNNLKDTLTLRDRIEHHVSTSMATIETSSLQRKKTIAAFVSYFKSALQGETSPIKYYLVKNTNKSKVSSFLDLLSSNGIQFGFLTQDLNNLNGYGYLAQTNTTVDAKTHDIVIPTGQTQSHLLTVLMESNPYLKDSLSYDLTAWCLPLAWGLDAYALKGSVPGYTKEKPNDRLELMPDRPLVYLCRWDCHQDIQFLAKLIEEGIHVSFNDTPLTLDGQEFPTGTLIVHRGQNTQYKKDWDKFITKAAKDFGVKLFTAKSGLVEKGPDLGSEQIHLIKKPIVALISSEEADPNAFGEVWHYFDQQLGYPLHIINKSAIEYLWTSDINTLILPDGQYGFLNEEKTKEKFKQWIRKGGKVIAMESTLNLLESMKDFAIKTASSDEPDSSSVAEPSYHHEPYCTRIRTGISNEISGAICQASIDDSHPLGYGMSKTYFTLKKSSSLYKPIGSGWNVGVLNKTKPLVSGFAGSKLIPKLGETLLFGVEDFGQGHVVYMVDNPLFRGFWENGKMIFGNAIFMVGQD